MSTAFSTVIPLLLPGTFKLFNTHCVIAQAYISSPETFQFEKYLSKNNAKNHDQKENYVGNKTFV